jgi:hypothetical protein
MPMDRAVTFSNFIDFVSLARDWTGGFIKRDESVRAIYCLNIDQPKNPVKEQPAGLLSSKFTPPPRTFVLI